MAAALPSAQTNASMRDIAADIGAPSKPVLRRIERQLDTISGKSGREKPSGRPLWSVIGTPKAALRAKPRYFTALIWHLDLDPTQLNRIKV
jgi:hypothetical protein